MPLIDLQTNLKSLKFTGIAPYVTKDINNPPVYNTLGHEISARVDDVSRLTKMLIDKPGIEFMTKQALLQASDPSNFNSEKQTIIGRAVENAGNIVKDTARTVGTILAQAGVNRTGTHFITPSPEYYYTSTAAAGQASTSPTIASDVSRTSVQVKKVSRYSYNEAVNLAALNNSSDDISDRANTHAEYTKPTQAALDAQAGNTIHIKTFKDRYTGATADSLEKSFMFAEANSGDDIGKTDIVSSLDSVQLDELDLVPLAFAKFPGTDYKIFRGFIGNITDNFQANWAGNQFVGRMEQFFVYTGFSRTLSFGFSVPIFSEAEQPYVYNKLNALVSHTAPEYGEGIYSGIPKGIITHLTVGDYIQTAGVLNSVGITVSNDVPWSHGPGETPMLLPQVLQLQIQFTPIHSSTPQYRGKALGNEKETLPFIANTKKVAASQPTQPEIVQTRNAADAAAQQEARLKAAQKAYAEAALEEDINRLNAL